MISDGFINNEIRKSNKNLFRVNLIILIIILTIFYFTKRYFYNFFMGPFDIELTELLEIENCNKEYRYYFKNIKIEGFIDTDFKHIEKRIEKYSRKVKSVKIVADFYILPINSKALLLKVPPREVNAELTGAIKPISKKVQKVIFPNYGENSKNIFLPFILDASNFRKDGYWFLAFCIPVLLIVVFNFYKLISRKINPDIHPTLKNLSRFGVPSGLIPEIDYEIETKCLYSDSLHIVTLYWIIYIGYFSLEFTRISDVIWIYKKHTIDESLGERMDQFSVYVHLRNGKRQYYPCSEVEANKLLVSIKSVSPHVKFGYSDKLDYLWKKKRYGDIIHLDANNL